MQSFRRLFVWRVTTHIKELIHAEYTIIAPAFEAEASSCRNWIICCNIDCLFHQLTSKKKEIYLPSVSSLTSDSKGTSSPPQQKLLIEFTMHAIACRCSWCGNGWNLPRDMSHGTFRCLVKLHLSATSELHEYVSYAIQNFPPDIMYIAYVVLVLSVWLTLAMITCRF